MIEPTPKSLVVLLAALVFNFAALPGHSQQTNFPPPSEHYPFASGAVERLDLGSGWISLKTPIGPRAFEVTSRTYIFRGTEKITLDKLRIGEVIKLSYRTNELGQALVERIKTDQAGTTTNSAGPVTAPR